MSGRNVQRKLGTNVGIIRSPIRASILPDHRGVDRMESLGWRQRRAAASAFNTLSCERETLHPKNPIKKP
jgi:hypothetical protein